MARLRAELPGPGSAPMARLRSELPGALAAAALASAIAVVLLKVWQANFGVPLYSSPGGDGLYGLAVIKGILEHGWYLTNSSLGAPGGQRLYDYPVFSGDSLYLLIVKADRDSVHQSRRGRQSLLPALLSVDCVSAYAGLRAVRISTGPSVVCAVLFTLLPYHFFDGESHIFQGSYFTVPLALLLGRRGALRQGPLHAQHPAAGCEEVSDVALRREPCWRASSWAPRTTTTRPSPRPWCCWRER